MGATPPPPPPPSPRHPRFSLRLPWARLRGRHRPPGLPAPGPTVTQVLHAAATEATPGHGAPPRRIFVTCMDYCPDQVQAVDLLDVDDFLAHHRPEWAKVRWINVDGLTDHRLIRALAEKYDLHPQTVDDMLHPGTRPRVEPCQGASGKADRLFIIARMIYLVEGQLRCEQISFYLGKTTLITFQETHGDVWDAVRARILQDGSRLRTNDVSFLLYALLDAVVDQCFPVIEHYSARLEEAEEEVLDQPEPAIIRRIHHVKHELLLLRREFRPMREMLYALQRVDHVNFSTSASLFLRDVYDHSVQVIELMETCREIAISLTETYMNALSHRMNEVMKVLAILSTIFMPLSFLAGIFGMNFPHMPEFEQSWTYPWAYPIGFYTACLSGISLMIWWFRKKRWV